MHPKIRFWSYVSEEVALENDNTLFISQPARAAWFFTGIRGLSQYDYETRKARVYKCPFEKLVNAKYVYLGGKQEFLTQQKEMFMQLAWENSYEINFKHLTPNYKECPEDGKVYEKPALYQIEVEPIVKNNR